MDQVRAEENSWGTDARTASGHLLLQVLNRINCGGVILDQSGSVVDINPAAETLLRPEIDGEALRPLTPDDARNALKALLRKSGTRFAIENDTWALIERPDRRPVAVHALHLGSGIDPGPLTTVVLIDLDQSPQPNAASLQKMFGLTPAEAKLAVQLARGEPLSDFAASAGLSMATARKQLAGIFQKTRTHRQAELVALLARVSILP